MMGPQLACFCDDEGCEDMMGPEGGGNYDGGNTGGTYGGNYGYVPYDGPPPPECAMPCESLMDDSEASSFDDMCGSMTTMFECFKDACKDDPDALALADEMMGPQLACFCDDEGCEDMMAPEGGGNYDGGNTGGTYGGNYGYYGGIGYYDAGDDEPPACVQESSCATEEIMNTIESMEGMPNEEQCAAFATLVACDTCPEGSDGAEEFAMYSGLMTKCMCGEIADEDTVYCTDAMNDMNDDAEGGGIPAECVNQADMAVLMAGGEGMDMNALSAPCLVAMTQQNLPAECVNQADMDILFSMGEGDLRRKLQSNVVEDSSNYGGTSGGNYGYYGGSEYDGPPPPECAMSCMSLMDDSEASSFDDMCDSMTTFFECITDACQDDPDALALADEMMGPQLACFCDGEGCEDMGYG